AQQVWPVPAGPAPRRALRAALLRNGSGFHDSGGSSTSPGTTPGKADRKRSGSGDLFHRFAERLRFDVGHGVHVLPCLSEEMEPCLEETRLGQAVVAADGEMDAGLGFEPRLRFVAVQ